MAVPGEQAGARYILIGGFLGAGKTTAMARLAAYLTDRGRRVGLISNDQSSGLADTAMLRARGFSVAEVVGGCFCCRFDSLLEACDRLRSESRPDVFLAEPVGSCTDLVATISYPLRRMYGDRFTVAPLSVLVDPGRAARVLGIEAGRSFSPKVAYVYRKQLEEADLIMVNKCDVLTESRREGLVSCLRRAFPQAEVLCCSAREGTGLEEWFERLAATESEETPTMELDYEQYAEGEAALGWLNGTIHLMGEEPFDANAVLLRLAERLGKRLEVEEVEIAHLKMTLAADDEGGGISAVSLASQEAAPELRETLAEPVEAGRLIINLRAEADPDVLRGVTEETLEEARRSEGGLRMRVEHMEHFRPAKPAPTHRMRVVA